MLHMQGHLYISVFVLLLLWLVRTGGTRLFEEREIYCIAFPKVTAFGSGAWGTVEPEACFIL